MEVTTSLDQDKWKDFVDSHPLGNIFQTPEMAEVYKKTKNREPLLLAVKNKSGDVLALMLAVIIKYLRGPWSTFTSRAIVQGGPLYVEGQTGNNALKLLIKEYDRIMQKYTLITEIRNLWDVSHIRPLLEDNEYNFEEHLNFLIRLDRSKEEIWRNIHKSRRKGINRAFKKGVVVERVKNKKYLPKIYNLLKETYTKAKIPLADFSLFESAFDVLLPNKMAKFYVAKLNNSIVATRIILNYKGLVYDWYAGSSKNYSNYYLNEAIIWHILEEHAGREFHTFDFGGAGKPNEEYGVREFKRRFGGRMVNFGRFIRIYSPIKLKIAKSLFSIYRRIL